jgi:hypothetical protein
MTIFDNNVSLYFFSAVLQANTALIAFAAVFAVFRFQMLVQSLHNKDAEIITFIDNYFARVPLSVPDEIRVNYNRLEDLFDGIRSLLSDPEYKPSYKNYVQFLINHRMIPIFVHERHELIQKQQSLIKRFRWPMISLVLVIVSSLCLLPMSNYLHTAEATFELLAIIVVVLLNIWALVLNIRFVFITIKE